MKIIKTDGKYILYMQTGARVAKYGLQQYVLTDRSAFIFMPQVNQLLLTCLI
jgi:hypothetical protein